MYEYFLYVATSFTTVCYLTEFYTLYLTYRGLYDKEKQEENRSVNAYSIKIRICVIIINGSSYMYYRWNNVIDPLKFYIIFFTLDNILFVFRIYFMYVLYRIVPRNLDSKNNQKHDIENPLHLNDLVEQ